MGVDNDGKKTKIKVREKRQEKRGKMIKGRKNKSEGKLKGRERWRGEKRKGKIRK